MTITDDDLVAVSSYLDGGMSADDMAVFEARLENEPALRAELDAMRSTLEAMGAIGSPDPVDLRAGVERKLRRRSRGRFYGGRSRRRERVHVELFLGVAVVAFAAIVLVSAPQSLGTLMRDDLPPTPTAERTPDASDERLGAVSPPTGATVFREQVYVIHTALDADAIEAALRSAVGDAAWYRRADTWVIDVPRAERVQWVERLGELGNVTRRQVERDQLGETASIEVTRRPPPSD